MKIKQIITILLVAIILASCAPSLKVVPTETAVPTSTFTPNPTATPIPLTATPTEMPFDFQEFLNTEKERLIKEYGYGSWEELTQKEVTDSIGYCNNTSFHGLLEK